MQGCGNDYVYLDCTKELIENVPETARRISDRHFGIGSDGLILIKKSDKADFIMDMYNYDGSRAQMCGNGIRCVAKYVYDKGLTNKKHITIETLSGIKEIDVTVENGKVTQATVNMGSPILQASFIPVISNKDKVIDEPIKVNGIDYRITCVSMGNPHAIVFVDDTKNLPIESIGPLFENHKIFPERVNTEFVKVIDKKNIDMRVWKEVLGKL
jgi:diaminopimelate epimerase